MIFVAHPDDETLACGGEMIHWPDCVIVHLTDGSPADLSDARNAGFASREDYARARNRELECALGQVGGREHRSLHLTDQQTWHSLPGLTASVRALIDEIQPAAILTHPYEGGHPDHDSAAFAVQSACLSLDAPSPQRLEAAFYNRHNGQFHPNEFLPGPPVTEITLDPATRARKERMFACFASQQPVLSLFSTAIERYRIRPPLRFL